MGFRGTLLLLITVDTSLSSNLPLLSSLHAWCQTLPLWPAYISIYMIILIYIFLEESWMFPQSFSINDVSLYLTFMILILFVGSWLAPLPFYHVCISIFQSLLIMCSTSGSWGPFFPIWSFSVSLYLSLLFQTLLPGSLMHLLHFFPSDFDLSSNLPIL